MVVLVSALPTLPVSFLSNNSEMSLKVIFPKSFSPIRFDLLYFDLWDSNLSSVLERSCHFSISNYQFRSENSGLILSYPLFNFYRNAIDKIQGLYSNSRLHL